MEAHVEPEPAEGDVPAGKELHMVEPEAAVSAVRTTRLAWENYLRCFFLLATASLVGLLAWRPSLLRFSLIMSLANPSRGESLAWRADDDPAPPPPARKAAPAPDEWRPQSSYSATWSAGRPPSRQDGINGGNLSASNWRRFSSNPWHWNDDVERAPHRSVIEAAPAQKPASEFRAGNLASWPDPTPTPFAGAPVNANPDPNGGLSLPMGLPPLPPPLPETRNGVQPVEPLPILPAPESVLDLPALPLPAVSLDNRGPASVPPLATPRPTVPPAAPRTTTPAEEPPRSTTAPAGLSGATAVRPPAPTEEVDWKNREITGPIPGAYLTIYPKLKFVGLCVPGQGYIRKYNQVGVPQHLDGAKMRAQDGRTPYGKYYIAERQRDSDGARLYISWPSPDDAARIGLDPGRQAEITHAWNRQDLPPQDTAAGGGVGLNGLRTWVETTEGGFSLEEPHMEEIFTALPDKAWVFIQP